MNQSTDSTPPLVRVIRGPASESPSGGQWHRPEIDADVLDEVILATWYESVGRGQTRYEVSVGREDIPGLIKVLAQALQAFTVHDAEAAAEEAADAAAEAAS